MELTETEKQTETVDTTDDVEHYVKRTNPGEKPPKFSQYALCGKRMSILLFEHRGSVCQKCLDVLRGNKNQE